jgi:phosphate starvation-inducible PhoH-like protein
MSKRLKRQSAYQVRQPVMPTLTPQSDKQSRYINAIYAGPVVVCTGYAGTGKTYIAAKLAARLYAERKIDQIIMTRPNVSAGQRIGFFPGTLEEKMDPWMRPLISRMKADLGGQYDTGVSNGNIRVEPFETMRGASYSGFVILDEAQNTTPEEMKMFLTRYESGRVIINGDIKQSDLKVKSGLSVLVGMIKRGELPFHHIDFSDVDDIVRSDVCRDVILAWDKYEHAG